MLRYLSEYMYQKGLPLNDAPILDGEIHRYSSRPEKPRDKDEWYAGFFEGDYLYCKFGSWRLPDESFVYKSWDSEEIPEDITYKLKEAQKKAADEIERKRKEAIEKAQDILSKAEIPAYNEYLKKKQVEAEEVYSYGNNLILPIKDIDNNLISLQEINPEGGKRFLSGSKVNGGMLILGEPKDYIRVAEGYATAKSIKQAVDCCVVVSFSAHNLTIVGEMLKAKYPNATIELCADKGKAGEEAALKWQKIVGTQVHFPVFANEHKDMSDFNDMLCLYGVNSISRILGKAYRSLGVRDFIQLERDPLEWYIDNLLVKGSINMLYGGEGQGKSWFSLELGFCCSLGMDFLKYNVNNSKSVLYVDGEMLDCEIQERIKSVAKRYNRANPSEKIFPEDNKFSFLTSQMLEEEELPPIDLFNSSSRKMLDKIIQKHDIVIFDNLWNLTLSGETGEDSLNYDSSWVKINTWLRKWKNQGKTLIVAHHKNKGNDASGSRRIKADMTTIIRLDPPELPPSILGFKVCIEKGRHIMGCNKIPYDVHLDQYRSTLQNGWLIYNP